jgi:transposase-like protein
VKESLSPHASPTAIARKHGLNTGQLYAWRRQLLSLRPEGSAGFARVEMTREPARPEAPPGVRVWLARGHTDMRKGMDGLEAALPPANTPMPDTGSQSSGSKSGG